MDKENLQKRLEELVSTIEEQSKLLAKTNQYVQLLEGARLECLGWLQKINEKEAKELADKEKQEKEVKESN